MEKELTGRRGRGPNIERAAPSGALPLRRCAPPRCSQWARGRASGGYRCPLQARATGARRKADWQRAPRSVRESSSSGAELKKWTPTSSRAESNGHSSTRTPHLRSVLFEDLSSNYCTLYRPLNRFTRLKSTHTESQA